VREKVSSRIVKLNFSRNQSSTGCRLSTLRSTVSNDQSVSVLTSFATSHCILIAATMAGKHVCRGFLNGMRYINPHFTYLLTLLTYRPRQWGMLLTWYHGIWSLLQAPCCAQCLWIFNEPASVTFATNLWKLQLNFHIMLWIYVSYNILTWNYLQKPYN